jgi:hypothetical protein
VMKSQIKLTKLEWDLTEQTNMRSLFNNAARSYI